MNERDIERDIERAEHAQRLLQDDLLSEALRVIRNEVISAWVSTEHKAEKEREGYWMFAKTVDNFELLLKGYIETGKLARVQLDHIKGRSFLQKIVG